jgi:hypothetical protein
MAYEVCRRTQPHIELLNLLSQQLRACHTTRTGDIKGKQHSSVRYHTASVRRTNMLYHARNGSSNATIWPSVCCSHAP